MILHNHNSTIRISLYAGLLMGLGSLAHGANVLINQNPNAGSGGSLVAAAQLRASTNNWDMALSNGRSYTGSNAVRSDLATIFSLPAKTYTFSLQYVRGEGFIFNVRDNATGRTTTQAWGNFTNHPGGDCVTTMGGRAPLLSFDSIQVEARATANRSSTSFSNLVFTSADLSTSGSFYSGTVNNRTQLPNTPDGTASQDLFANVNLADHSWQLSGEVTFMRNILGGNGSDVSLTVNVGNFNQGAVVATPEPSGAFLMVGAAGAMLARRRRNPQAEQA